MQEALLSEVSRYVEEARAGSEDALPPLLAACERVLALAPEDAETLRAKLTCLVELGRYGEAEALAAELGEPARYERAYALYQLGREADAMRALPADLSGASGAEQTLAAQIKYRQAEYGEAARLFRAAAEQAASEGDGTAAEHYTNVLASLVLSRDSAAATSYGASLAAGLEAEQFELAYNLACAHIGSGEYSAARDKLAVALRACRESLGAENLPEEEVEVELGVLTAQAAFVDQQLGDKEAAAAAYATLASFKAELEVAVAAVVANNTVALRGEANLFDSWKKAKANLAEPIVKKLTPHQRQAFLANAALLSVAMSRPEQAKECVSSLRSEFPASPLPAIIEAASAARARPADAEALLRAAAAAADASDPRPSLALAQLQLDGKDPAAALRTLHGLRSLSTSPGYVGALVALHERTGDIDAASTALEAALSAEAAPLALLRSGAQFYARHGRWAEAAALRRRLVEAAPRDAAALAALVVAESHVDAEAPPGKGGPESVRERSAGAPSSAHLLRPPRLACAHLQLVSSSRPHRLLTCTCTCACTCHAHVGVSRHLPTPVLLGGHGTAPSPPRCPPGKAPSRCGDAEREI